MRALFLSLLVLLAGCASSPPSPQSIMRPAQGEAAPFDLDGRIAVTYEGGNSSATVHWTHRPAEDEILLLAPLGQTVARINSNANGVELETSDRLYTAQDTEDLTQQVLGWSLPLSGLRYWVLALPTPENKADIVHDGNGRVKEIYQDGWAIRYARYTGETPDSLPTRVILQRDEVELQLLVDEWKMQ
jgi:outer membrane lipoprotein LolB